MTPDIDFSDSNFVDDILKNCNNLRTRATKAEASLAEAEALTKKNAELINGYLARIAELEYQIIHQTGVSACRIEERERLQKQIAALREIAIEQKAAHIAFFGFHRNMNEDETKNKAREEARRQLAKEHPEAFG